MRGLGKLLFACVGAVAVSGCGAQLENAQRLSPSGSDFNVALYKGYVDLAKSESSEADYRDSDVFAGRAIAAGSGQSVQPEAIAGRDLPADKVGELTTARQRLVSALAKPESAKYAGDAATAQVMFDCWMQEQEENFQPEDIARCRSGYYDNIARLEGNLNVAAAPPPPEPARPDAVKFVVPFDFDKADLNTEAQAVIAAAQAAASKIDGARIVLTGNADRSGSSQYNKVLSELRADAVAKAMVAGGIPASAISTSAYGETNPARATDDGVAEAVNRRVEIIVQP